MRFLARRLTSETYQLGEGVLWDERAARVLWVDITAGLVLSAPWHGGASLLRPNPLFRSRMPTVDFVCLGEGEEVVVAEHERLAVLSAKGEPLAVGPALLPAGSDRRLNDGVVDPQGRILIGSLRTNGASTSEVALRVEEDGTVTTLVDDLTLANGMGFSPNGRTAYLVDTLASSIRSANYPGGSWHLAFTVDGLPDGLCVDERGDLWVAMWGAGEVRHFAPDGRLLGVVSVDAPNVSSVAFGGPDLAHLLITTAREGLDAVTLRASPASGALFVTAVDVRGLPTHRWSGSRQLEVQ